MVLTLLLVLKKKRGSLTPTRSNYLYLSIQGGGECSALLMIAAAKKVCHWCVLHCDATHAGEKFPEEWTSLVLVLFTNRSGQASSQGPLYDCRNATIGSVHDIRTGGRARRWVDDTCVGRRREGGKQRVKERRGIFKQVSK